MKIATLCFLHPHKVPGGQQRVAYDLFQQAALKYGRENSLFIASDLQAEPLRTAQSSSLVEVAANEFVYICQRYDYKFFTNFDTDGQLEIVRLLESFKPDVIHMHHFLGFGLDLVPLMRSRLPKTRVVFTLHEFIPICHNNGHLRRKYDGGICEQVHAVSCQQCFPGERLDYFEHRKSFFEDLLSSFDEISTVSGFARQVVERNLSLKSPIKVIQNGPVRNTEAAVPAPSRTAKPKRCVIGFIGQVHPVKGVDLLLDAVSDLVEDGSASALNIEVQIFGNLVDQSYREKLEAHVARANQSSLKTVLRGMYSSTNLEAVFSEIDIVVVPSMWPESYCLTADEAVLARKTLVCANLPAIRERIHGSEGVFLFERGSIKDLKRALIDAIAAHKKDAWGNPFSVPVTTIESVFEKYVQELYVGI